jgi:hypothetical protein
LNVLELPPRVSHTSHYIVNGLIWSLAGINLVRLAIGWYLESDILAFLVGIVSTVILAVVISQTRFKIIAGKFNKHIVSLPEKSWFFAFQKVRHYFLLIFMMFLGIGLKEYSGLNEYTLALIYSTMGSTLVLTSYHFFVQVFITSNTELEQSNT